jgi:hypothetical protein
VFIRKLITDTNTLVATIQRNFDKNVQAMNLQQSQDNREIEEESMDKQE